MGADSSIDVFDTYITRDEDRVFLIDINPYAPRTDSLLFAWEEIIAMSGEQTLPSFRVVESEIQASQSMPKYSHNRYPKDVVGLSDDASIAALAKQLQESATQSKQRASSPIGR